MAGDLVEGRWNLDTDDRRLFGPVSQGADETSLRQCRSAIRRAGDVYYGHYRSLFHQQGWDLYPAIGDHELLDDRHGRLNERWHPDGSLGRVPDNRYHLVDACKDVWADHFTRRADGSPRFENRPDGPAASTAYAVSFADVLTLITVDMFTKTPKGVRLGVFDHQLAWLRTEITEAKRRGHVVVVQGHIPAVNPYRRFVTGNLHVPEGMGSSFYRALDECGADFLFTGEVHDTTVLQKRPRAPIQISHGCIFRYGFNYLIGNVSGDGTLTLDYFEVPLLRASRDHGLWCTDRDKRQRTTLGYGVPLHRGRLVHSDGRMASRTRKLGVYHPGNDPYEFATHLPTVLH